MNEFIVRAMETGPFSPTQPFIVSFVYLAIFLVLYFLPWVIALNRNHRNATPICLTTLFFGWTFLGWGVALIWACSDNVKKLQTASNEA